MQWPKGTTAGQRAVHPGQQQAASWWGVVAGQGGQFVLEALEAQIDIQQPRVFAEDLPRGRQGLGGVG